jgi:hypothetical protein
MANNFKTYSTMTFKLDNATGHITDITSVTNNAALNGAMNIIEALAISDTTKTVYPGVGTGAFSLNGWINTTSDALFGPLVGNRTSISKTFGFFNGLKYYNGEAFPSKVAMSGKANDMMTWSSDFTVNGAVTRTSVAPA